MLQNMKILKVLNTNDYSSSRFLYTFIPPSAIVVDNTEKPSKFENAHAHSGITALFESKVYSSKSFYITSAGLKPSSSSSNFVFNSLFFFGRGLGASRSE